MEKLFANELGQLANRVSNHISSGTNTIFFILFSNMPSDCIATYRKIVCELKPHKFEQHCSHLTVGGNQVDYLFHVSTLTSDITTFKCLVNSVLSTPSAKLMTIDIRDFYLNTPMKRFKYMKLPIDMIPDKIIQQYNLLQIVHVNGYI